MKGIAVEGVVELLVAVGYAVVTVLLTALAVVAELFGAQSFGTDPVLAVWAVVVGAIALYFGPYVLGYGRLLPYVRGGA